MKLVEVYQNAIKNKFAIGAYNFYNMANKKGHRVQLQLYFHLIHHIYF